LHELFNFTFPIFNSNVTFFIFVKHTIVPKRNQRE
jgi:hypothetical protein